MNIFPRKQKSYYIFFGCILSAGIFFCGIDGDARHVAAPIIAASLGSILFFLKLTESRKEFPLGDLGAITGLALLCYTIIPPIQYLLSNMTYSESSARQLFILQPNACELGAFTWWYVLYLLSFLFSYLSFIPKHEKNIKTPLKPKKHLIFSLLTIFVVLFAFRIIVKSLYGLNITPIYGSEAMYLSNEAFLTLPLILQQVFGLIESNGIMLLVQISLLLVLFLNWKKNTCRCILFLWLFFLCVSTILFMGTRTNFILTAISSILMYHQFVQPLKTIKALTFGIFLLCVFFVIGLMRGGENLAANVQNLNSIVKSGDSLFNSANEFQVLFGGNYDLQWLEKNRQLIDAPIQFAWYDIIMLIPQQLLPFDKINVQQWYLNKSSCPGFFMFNPISQAIIGFRETELLLRGCLLGFIFAKIRTWYVKHSSSFWVTLFYFYITIISYYTIRSTAFYVLLASILYRFIPFYVFIRIIEKCRPRVFTRLKFALASN